MGDFWKTDKIVAWLFLAVLLFNSPGRGEPVYRGFSAIDQKKSTVILVGDTQKTSHWELWREQNDKQRQLIFGQIARREPAFIIHLGDLTVRGSSNKHWALFDRYNEAILKKGIPYMPVLGNHEYYGDNDRAMANYFSRFQHLQRRKWYSFTFKGIAFIMLDGNISKLTKEETERQQQWYEHQLQEFEDNTDINFIVVCCHKPPFTNSKVIAPDKKVESSFVPPFLTHQKTVFFFSGHCHSYERFEQGGKYFIVSGGGGGPRHRVEVNKAKRKFDDRFEGGQVRFFHFCELEVQKDGLIFRVIKLNPDSSFSPADEIRVNR